jgi:homoserine O-succinyltransferase
LPLLANTELPTFELLKRQGEDILEPDHPGYEGHKDLHIGFLNLMPDAAFKATERQFLYLVGSSKRQLRFIIHPFSIEGVRRDEMTQDYINAFYESFEAIKEAGLDALILTGTNPGHTILEQEPFWDPLGEVIDWAMKNVTSMMCSCLAVHAIVKHMHNIERKPLSKKRWGVYSQVITNPNHPLLNNLSSPFDVPHSRNNDVSAEQLEAAGFKILVQGADSGVHMAVSPDMFKMVYLQGHPEYDGISLLKEYKREVGRFFEGQRETYPQSPENYFTPEIDILINDYIIELSHAKQNGLALPSLPESKIEPLLKNTWIESGKQIFDNWLGLVDQVTNEDRHLPFKAGIDPDDPLQLKSSF